MPTAFQIFKDKMKKIFLKNIITIFPTEEKKDWKVHFACNNEKNIEPLDEFLTDPARMIEWNRSKKPDGRHPNGEPKFKQKWHKYIFHLVSFYPEKDTWLFVGIFKVVTHNSEKHEIELTNLFEEYIGRLKIQIPLSNRIRDRYLEKVYDEMIVKEILPASYTGEEFLGYENINLSFKMLKNIINSDEKSWRKALENILGIYLITDSLNGKLYVGSAYGENGLWSRWKEYTATGHGGNKKLQKVSKNMGIDYLFENFSMSLLEVIPPNKTIDYVLKREKHWKKCLSSQNHGYNEN